MEKISKSSRNKVYDQIGGMLFFLFTVVFLWFFLNNEAFLQWTYARHHNVLSWYIRPLMVIPICYFAYRRSWTGVFAFIFALFSSMAWFPIPETSNESVLSFLAMEMEWIRSPWDMAKIITTLTVPLYFALVIVAAWQRKWKWLLFIVVIAAVMKVGWSIADGGSAGMELIKPAGLGVIVFIIGFMLIRAKTKGKEKEKE